MTDSTTRRIDLVDLRHVELRTLDGQELPYLDVCEWASQYDSLDITIGPNPCAADSDWAGGTLLVRIVPIIGGYRIERRYWELLAFDAKGVLP